MAASLAAPEPYGPNSAIRLVWGFLCQECITPFLSCFVTPFFCSTRAASILPSRPHMTVAVARSGGQGRRFFSAAVGLSLTDASTAAGCRDRVIRCAMIRGEPAIGREQSREPRLYSVEPTWVPTMKQSYASAGKAPRRRVHSSQRHCSHSRMRIAATSDRHRLPRRIERRQVPNPVVLSHFN